MPSFPVVVKIGHAHSGIGKVGKYSTLAALFWQIGAHTVPPLRPGEGGEPHEVPGHSQRGGADPDVHDHGTARRLQIRHQNPEDRRRLQSLHVGATIISVKVSESSETEEQMCV